MARRSLEQVVSRWEGDDSLLETHFGMETDQITVFLPRHQQVSETDFYDRTPGRIPAARTVGRSGRVVDAPVLAPGTHLYT
jgi:hypothetical protein